jgi:hypothetical protein
MSASVVQICNLALMKFGNLSITSITAPTNKEERSCSVFYPLMRDEMVVAHPWNFAMKRADISAQLADTPSFGYDYAYQLPTDCLRVWELVDSKAEWVVESGQLLVSQDSEIYIRYIRQVLDPGLFSPSFVNCLATRLGAELAGKLSDDKAMRQALLQELYKVELPAAMWLNAIEGSKPRHTDEQSMDRGNFSWQAEGR